MQKVFALIGAAAFATSPVRGSDSTSVFETYFELQGIFASGKSKILERNAAVKAGLDKAQQELQTLPAADYVCNLDYVSADLKFFGTLYNWYNLTCPTPEQEQSTAVAIWEEAQAGSGDAIALIERASNIAFEEVDYGTAIEAIRGRIKY